MTSSQELQRLILGALSIRGDMCVTDLAKVLRRKSHAIRYHLTRLLEAGQLKQSVLIDQRALGFQICTMLFNLPVERQEAAVQFLKDHHRVAWIFQNHGPREFEVSINVKNAGELVTFAKAFGKAIGTYPREQVITFEEDMIGWGYRYSLADYKQVQPLHFRAPKVFEADALDLKLIRAYRSGQDVRFASLARLVGAPQSTIKFRLQKLEKAKVISEPRYLLIAETGRVMQAQILLRMSVRNDSVEERLRSICQNTQHVTSLTSCFGGWDYKVVVHGESLQSLLEAHDTLKQQLSSDVISSEFYMRRRWLKASTGV
jgi:DNA-binding Lrp family transcriptional regulator